ncbi:MAG: hypothetical protein E3J72_12740 [Planctomycetota bacterium]|nr:MAG: hypothetical protein E3J72_12740 [Planctomycetota bacterium]
MPAAEFVQFPVTPSGTTGANERCWAMLPVAPVLHAGEKFLAFTTEGIYVFGCPATSDPDHPGKRAYFFDDEFSSPPLVELKSCFRLTGEISCADIKKCAVEGGWLAPVLVLETPETSRRFALPRNAWKTAAKVMRIINGETGKELRRYARPAGIILLFTGLLCAAAPGMSLIISLLLIVSGSVLLFLAAINSSDHGDILMEKSGML